MNTLGPVDLQLLITLDCRVMMELRETVAQLEIGVPVGVMVPMENQEKMEKMDLM